MARTRDDLVVHGQDRAVLDRAQASAVRRTTHWSPRALSPGMRTLLWALRIYVMLMLAVVGIQIARLG